MKGLLLFLVTISRSAYLIDIFKANLNLDLNLDLNLKYKLIT